MQSITRCCVRLAFAWAVTFAFGAVDVSAQAAQAACTAEVTPASIQAGQRAVKLTVELSGQVGEITGVQGANSGIVVAQAQDLPRTELAANSPAPRPIAMGAERNTWTVWVNTTAARPGSHTLTFAAGQSGCAGEVAVAAGAGAAPAPGAAPTPAPTPTPAPAPRPNN